MPCVGVEDCYLILNLSEEILQICSLCGPRRQDPFSLALQDVKL